MVQKGRGYRAAQPRANYNDLRYNQRCPMKWSIRGDISTILFTLSFDGTQHTDPCVYTPSVVGWSWDYFYGTFPTSAQVHIELLYKGRSPQWQFATIFTNAGGGVYRTWWDFDTPGETPSTPYLYPYSTPTGETVGTGWLHGNSVRLSPLLYAEEP